MDDQEYKRLKRFIIVSWSILLIVVVGLAIWGSYEIKNLKEIVAQKPQSQTIEKPVKGIDGKNGVSIVGPIGPSGLVGIQGNTGKTGLRGEKGNKGDQGNPGVPGRVVFVRQNPGTGEEECKYGDSTIWFPILECSQ